MHFCVKLICFKFYSEQYYSHLEKCGVSARHLRSIKDNIHSSAPGAPLALTPGRSNCRLEQRPFTVHDSWAFAALICLFLMALSWILAVHQHVCLLPCACLLATATTAPISNLGFSPDCIFQDHASQFGSCCCWPFTSDVFDYRK